MYLRKLKVFDADREAVQQINYSGNLNRTKEKKEKGTAIQKSATKVWKMYNNIIDLITL